MGDKNYRERKTKWKWETLGEERVMEREYKLIIYLLKYSNEN